ncbi:MAG TPA: hypothetical protein PLA50_13895, partial [Bacteroidia bacterium]|nr:hypothetical protein [Bacteroidia bacterium]
YPMGSNDQTAPWLHGMWRYLDSGLASEEEWAAMVAKVESVADALAASGWRMPCDTGAPSPYRGTFAGDGWEFAPRLLFLMKCLHVLTGKEIWAERYHAALSEQGQVSGMTRLDVCRRGMLFEHERRHSWTCASGAVCLRGLWELEDDPDLKAAYAVGLKAGAELALTSLPLHAEFDPAAQQTFHADWRVLNEWWKPQTSEQEAVDVAMVQVKELGKRSPRRYREFTFVREPAYAAWLVTLCPDADLLRRHRGKIEQVIAHYDYGQLYYSQFFPVEAAWYRLREIE